MREKILEAIKEAKDDYLTLEQCADRIEQLYKEQHGGGT